MSKGPERIWVDPGAVEIVQAATKVEPEYDVQYIRADLVDAQDAAWAERVAALEAAVAAARAEGMREAARIGGDAAVAALLRQEPDAGQLRQQATRQAIALPIFKAAEAAQ